MLSFLRKRRRFGTSNIREVYRTRSRIFFFRSKKFRKIRLNKTRYRQQKRQLYDYNVLFAVNKYVDHLSIACNQHRVSRLKKTFTSKLHTRKYLFSIYDKSIKIASDKKEKQRLNTVNAILTKPLFRLDILLWYLKFFVSVSASRQCINRGTVFINNKSSKSNYFIKRGDILTFKMPADLYKLNHFQKIEKKFLDIRHFFPFMEYDYYTNSFIVLKSWNELTSNDLTILFSEYKNLKSVSYK